MRPRSTYRLQLREEFGFADAAQVAGYLADLGVSHAYLSPCLQAADGSTHGYDVVDPRELSESLGGAAGYARMSEALAGHGVGQLLDIVPNHMARDGRRNAWWWDVLENGPSSRFASFFDIDWESGGTRGALRVLVPVLEDRYGAVLERHELTLARRGGSFVVRYRSTELPISPRTVDDLLSAAADAAGSPKLRELAAEHGDLPDSRLQDDVAVAARHEEKARLAAELDALCDAEPAVVRAIDAELARLESNPDALDRLLQRQNFRLAYWRVADEELDYRRFLNIGELVGLRVEDDEVFAATHGLVLDLVRRGAVGGLRVDHVDGLSDPEAYLHRLRRAAGDDTYLVVEKVLLGDEALREGWPVEGTTGYDFCARVNELFVDPQGEVGFLECYEDFLGQPTRYDEVLRDAKRLVARGEFASEVDRLVRLLAEICDRHLSQRDRTRRELRAGLVGMLAGFGVYRTYVQPGRPLDANDRRWIDAAVTAAIDAGDVDAELVGFLGELLALEHPGGPETEFALRFPQLCAAVTAKGLEDTALYRYLRLTSLNEVGGDPTRFGGSAGSFHDHCARIAQSWPATLNTLETHDTKRSADVRARLNVLSELPAEWRGLLEELDAAAAPLRPALLDRNTEYLIAQTAVGTWPFEPERLAAYVRKATKEAKTHTSWGEPDDAYDSAVEAFVLAALGSAAYRQAIETFLAATRLVELGRLTSLAQTTLLLTAPGVPDLYQGSEVWHLALVDPDNRRAVDFDRRRDLLAELDAREGPPEVALAEDDEGRHKLWLASRLLRHRAAHPELYEAGRYEPLEAAGACAAHLVAFRRDALVVAVPRLVAGLADGWEDTSLPLPPGTWHDVLTGRSFADDVEVAALLGSYPVAVLVTEPAPATA